jgi:hypothetical protein
MFVSLCSAQLHAGKFVSRDEVRHPIKGWRTAAIRPSQRFPNKKTPHRCGVFSHENQKTEITCSSSRP